MKSTLFLLILSMLATSCFNETRENDWKIIYKNDEEGHTLMGSKADLINAIRQGQDLKIGWGYKGSDHSIEHLSEPIWLAILDEQEVIAHLDPQVLSTIDWGKLSADYKDPKNLIHEWRVVMTTKGEFDAVWYDRKGDSIFKRVPQNHVMTWFSAGVSKNSPTLFDE